MTLNYQKIWNVMNDLEMVTTKISSAREILDSAIDKLEEHQYDKAGTLLYAADEFLQYYLQEFDTKFKDAWKETVTKVKQQEIDDCMPPWGHSDMEALRYTDKEMDAMCDNAAKQDKVVKWQLPVEEVEIGDTGEQEYFVTFPDDLLEAANLKPGDDVEWVDRNDGSFLLRKTTQSKTYMEMVAAGYTMTADGFWIKE
jgi:antitoxin component of MazEF toxin-antitoxin module